MEQRAAQNCTNYVFLAYILYFCVCTCFSKLTSIYHFPKKYIYITAWGWTQDFWTALDEIVVETVQSTIFQSFDSNL